MNHPEPKKLATNLRQLATALEKRGDLALRLAKDMQAENQGHGPGPKNGVSDPTGNAGSKDNPDRHVLDNLKHSLRMVHSNSADLAEQIVNITGNLDDKGQPIKPAFKKERLNSPCKYCEDDATKRGMCDSCYQFQWDRKQRTGCEWAELPPIPRSVIQERSITREAKKRARANPLTGEVDVA